MPYIGAKELKASDIRRFDVTSSTSATHTLTWTPPTEQSLIVTINGIKQHEDAYSVSGTTLTLSSPLVATDKLEVIGINDIGTTITPAQNSVDLDKLATTGTPSSSTFLRGDMAWATPTDQGKVLQVVSTFKNDTWSSAASDSYQAITGLSASITPSSTSNKVLIILSVTYGIPDNVWPGFKISRDAGSSFIAIANNDGSGRDFTSFAMSFNVSVDQEFSLLSGSLNYLDSPSTTSAVTYQVYAMGRTGFGSVYLNRTQWDNNDIYSGKRGVSSITLMEIAG